LLLRQSYVVDKRVSCVLSNLQLRRSLRRSRRAGLAAVAGVALGLAVLGFAAAFGAGLLTQSYPLVGEALRWAGVAYLVWLAWETAS
jgi:threonine/homoserine/homoserine lactone efflux protein